MRIVRGIRLAADPDVCAAAAVYSAKCFIRPPIRDGLRSFLSLSLSLVQLVAAAVY